MIDIEHSNKVVERYIQKYLRSTVPRSHLGRSDGLRLGLQVTQQGLRALEITRHGSGQVARELLAFQFSRVDLLVVYSDATQLARFYDAQRLNEANEISAVHLPLRAGEKPHNLLQLGFANFYDFVWLQWPAASELPWLLQVTCQLMRDGGYVFLKTRVTILDNKSNELSSASQIEKLIKKVRVPTDNDKRMRVIEAKILDMDDVMHLEA